MKLKMISNTLPYQTIPNYKPATKVYNKHLTKGNIGFAADVSYKVVGDLCPLFIEGIELGFKEIPDKLFNYIKKSIDFETRLGKKGSETFADIPKVLNAFKYIDETGIPADTGSAACINYRDSQGNLHYLLGFFEKPTPAGFVSTPSSANQKSVWHEFLHLFDHVYKKNNGIRLSQTKEFKKVTKKDLSELRKDTLFSYDYDKDFLNNITQNCIKQKTDPNEIALYEIFAHTGSVYKKPFMGQYNNEVIKRAFPETLKYIKKNFDNNFSDWI